MVTREANRYKVDQFTAREVKCCQAGQFTDLRRDGDQLVTREVKIFQIGQFSDFGGGSVVRWLLPR